jgi:hypothetical protein
MSNQVQLNLDRLAAEHAQAIIRELVDLDNKGNKRTDTKEIKKAASATDNTATKALGVLQENGVYACFLYLLAKEKENRTVVVKEMLKLLEGLNFGWQAPKSNGEIDTKPEAVLPFISDTVTENLERLLLAKETLEQMLIYARYGAKARS